VGGNPGYCSRLIFFSQEVWASASADGTRYPDGGASKSRGLGQPLQILHQPFGLTCPSTDLQALGEMNKLQLAQFLSPFGESR
jgi:hypothetical protein